MSIDSVSKTIDLFVNKTNAHNYQCETNSILDKERKTLGNDKKIGNTIALISVLFDASIQHLYGYLLNINNLFPLAAFSCFRSYLETAALCTWLSDPKINATERLARQLTYRINEQMYFLKPFQKERDYESLKDQKSKKINDLGMEGKEFGLQLKLDKNKNIIGINEGMPSISNLIENCFGLKHYYSYLSNVVHGHHTEMITAGGRIGNKVDVNSIEMVPINREANQQLLENLEICFKNSFGVVLDSIWELFGWMPSEFDLANLNR